MPSIVEKPIILVSDTIHTAKEMENVLLTYADEKPKIKVGKIFCYLRNEDGLKSYKHLSSLIGIKL